MFRQINRYLYKKIFKPPQGSVLPHHSSFIFYPSQRGRKSCSVSVFRVRVPCPWKRGLRYEFLNLLPARRTCTKHGAQPLVSIPSQRVFILTLSLRASKKRIFRLNTLLAGFHFDRTQNWACYDAGFQTQVIAGSIFWQKMAPKPYYNRSVVEKSRYIGALEVIAGIPKFLHQNPLITIISTVLSPV